jgi:hypothetical protein
MRMARPIRPSRDAQPWIGLREIDMGAWFDRRKSI